MLLILICSVLLNFIMNYAIEIVKFTFFSFGLQGKTTFAQYHDSIKASVQAAESPNIEH